MEDGNPPGSLSPLLAGRLLPEPKGSSHANELSQTDLNPIAGRQDFATAKIKMKVVFLAALSRHSK
jgi:hypothetical protein